MAARREELDASAAQSTGASREDGGHGSWLQQLGGEALAGLGSGWLDSAGATEVDGAGKDEPSCSGTLTSDTPDVDEGFAGTGFHPSEIAAAAAYGLFVGSAWSGIMSGPLPLGPREDISDEELMAARPRDVMKAAHHVRLQAIQSRRVKTCANLKQGTNKAATNGSRKVDSAAQGAAACSNGGHEAGASMDREEAPGASLDAEMCAVCQINFEEGEHCLACRNCDSGFHVACLNKWLLRADTCPCCRSKVSALTPLTCGNEEDAAC